MTEYNIRPAEKSDIIPVVRNATKEDVRECKALYGEDAKFGVHVRASFMASRNTSFIITADDERLAMFGVRPPALMDTMAIPWLIATNEVRNHWLKCAKSSKQIISIWAKEFPYMQNYVHQEHTVAVRWLQWLGFRVYYPKPVGPFGGMFHRFEMRQENV